MNIGVTGNIGAGKTTFARLMAERLGGKTVLEPVADNPYLADFYKDPATHAFPLQCFFLSHRLRNTVEAARTARDNDFVWMDRTIYEDRDIFAKHLANTGVLSARDWATYQHLFATFEPLLETPEIYFYLRASVPTLLDRIAQRGRAYETGIDAEYLGGLNVLYDKLSYWIDATGKPLIQINMDIIDLSNPEDAETIVTQVAQVLAAHSTMKQQDATIEASLAGYVPGKWSVSELAAPADRGIPLFGSAV